MGVSDLLPKTIRFFDPSAHLSGTILARLYMHIRLCTLCIILFCNIFATFFLPLGARCNGTSHMLSPHGFLPPLLSLMPSFTPITWILFEKIHCRNKRLHRDNFKPRPQIILRAMILSKQQKQSTRNFPPFPPGNLLHFTHHPNTTCHHFLWRCVISLVLGHGAGSAKYRSDRRAAVPSRPVVPSVARSTYRTGIRGMACNGVRWGSPHVPANPQRVFGGILKIVLGFQLELFFSDSSLCKDRPKLLCLETLLIFSINDFPLFGFVSTAPFKMQCNGFQQYYCNLPTILILTVIIINWNTTSMCPRVDWASQLSCNRPLPFLLSNFDPPTSQNSFGTRTSTIFSPVLVYYFQIFAFALRHSHPTILYIQKILFVFLNNNQSQSGHWPECPGQRVKSAPPFPLTFCLFSVFFWIFRKNVFNRLSPLISSPIFFILYNFIQKLPGVLFPPTFFFNPSPAAPHCPCPHSCVPFVPPDPPPSPSFLLPCPLYFMASDPWPSDKYSSKLSNVCCNHGGRTGEQTYFLKNRVAWLIRHFDRRPHDACSRSSPHYQNFEALKCCSTSTIFFKIYGRIQSITSLSRTPHMHHSDVPYVSFVFLFTFHAHKNESHPTGYFSAHLGLWFCRPAGSRKSSVFFNGAIFFLSSMDNVNQILFPPLSYLWNISGNDFPPCSRAQAILLNETT